MTESQQALAFALKMYGEAMVKHIRHGVSEQSTYENMCFWQNQAWHVAEDVAKESNVPKVIEHDGRGPG